MKTISDQYQLGLNFHGIWSNLYREFYMTTRVLLNLLNKLHFAMSLINIIIQEQEYQIPLVI